MAGRLKRRLIGAIVLISLAVIFVPMVFDVRDASRPVLQGSGIPPKPPGFKVEILPLELPPAASQTAPVVSTEPAGAPGKVPAPAKEQAPVRGQVPPRKVKQSPVKAQTKPVPVTESKPAVKSVRPSSPPATTSSKTAWIVQLGSFSSMSNAVKLRDRLRNKGFTAFIERSHKAGDRTVRVRVGPEILRARADKMQRRIKNKLGINGIVLEYTVQ